MAWHTSLLSRSSKSVRETEFPSVDISLLSNHARVTDSYLLVLARANGGKLATFDHRLGTEAVAEGKAALALL